MNRPLSMNLAGGASRAMVAVAVLLLSACGGGGSDRVLSISATGAVGGIAYFDQNGNRDFESTLDTPLRNVRVRLFVRGTTEEVATALSNNSGAFVMGS